MSSRKAQQLNVHTLGGLRLSLDGQAITGFVSQKKSEALIVYLACNPMVHSREVLASLFWGEHPEKRALNNLSVLINNVKKQLGDFLIITRKTIVINQESNYRLDVQEFSEQFRTVKGIDQNTKTPDLDKLTKAVEIYQGKFLDKFMLSNVPDFETWLVIEQERYQKLVISALEYLLSNHFQEGNYSEGIQLVQKILELDPFNENANHQLIYILALEGKRGKALAAFESFETLFFNEFGLEPANKTIELTTVIREGKLASATNRIAPEHKLIESLEEKSNANHLAVNSKHGLSKKTINPPDKNRENRKKNTGFIETVAKRGADKNTRAYTSLIQFDNTMQDRIDDASLIMERIELLSKVPLFANTPTYLLASLAEIIQEKTVEMGKQFITEGTIESVMYVIVNGRVRVHKHGKTIILLEDGDTVGEMGVLNSQPRSADVSTETSTLLFSIEKAAFDQLVIDCPAIAQNVIQVLVSRLQLEGERFSNGS